MRSKIAIPALLLVLGACGAESSTVVDAGSDASVAVTQPSTTVANAPDMPATTLPEHMDDEHADDEHADDEHMDEAATDEHDDDMADMDHSAMSVDLADEGAVADRTIEVVMTEFAFDPAPMEVTAGETIEFVVVNEGVIQHEFRVTTQEEIDHHVAEGHSDHTDGMEPGVMLVDPGQTGSMLVTFHESGEFDMIACLIPAHYEAGMAAELHIEP